MKTIKGRETEAVVLKAREILSRAYSRVVTPESDGTYRAEIIEFPGCVATGKDATAAIMGLEDTAFSWVMSALDRNQKVPEPVESAGAFSGKLMLRLPKSLHRKAAYAASRDGVSLNQYIVYGLSEQIGKREATVPSISCAVQANWTVVQAGNKQADFRKMSASAVHNIGTVIAQLTAPVKTLEGATHA